MKDLPHYRDFSQSIIPEPDISDRFCPRPFERVEIHHGSGPDQLRGFGDVYVCCSGWLSTKIGNYHDQDLRTLWNSPEAHQIRESIIDGSFKYCNKQACPYIHSGTLPKRSELSAAHQQIVAEKRVQLDSLPIEYNLCYDRSCNLSCPSCRREMVFFSEGEGYEAPMRINEKLLRDLFSEPHSRRIRLLITGSGDPFASLVFRALIESIEAKDFPGLETELFTNGVLFNDHNWKKLHRLHGKITRVSVSVDAATPETYAVVRRGGHWKQLVSNLKFIGSLRKEGSIKDFCTNYVVQLMNYREIPQFVELCRSVDVDGINFSFISDWKTRTPQDQLRQCVWRRDHPEFEELVRVLAHPILDDRIVRLGPLAAYRNGL